MHNIVYTFNTDRETISAKNLYAHLKVKHAIEIMRNGKQIGTDINYGVKSKKQKKRKPD